VTLTTTTDNDVRSIGRKVEKSFSSYSLVTTQTGRGKENGGEWSAKIKQQERQACRVVWSRRRIAGLVSCWVFSLCIDVLHPAYHVETSLLSFSPFLSRQDAQGKKVERRREKDDFS